jgi:hypothetical protein
MLAASINWGGTGGKVVGTHTKQTGVTDVTTAVGCIRRAERRGVTLARSWRYFPEICDRTTTRDHDFSLSRIPLAGMERGRAAEA